MLRLLIGFEEDLVILDDANSVLRSITEGGWVSKDQKLHDEVERLCGSKPRRVSENEGNGDGPRKRPRLLDYEHGAEARSLTSEVCRLLGSKDAGELTGLSLVASDGFEKLDEPERCTVIKDLGLLSCALAGTLTQAPEAIGLSKDWSSYKCSCCDVENVRESSFSPRKYAEGSSELLKALESIQRLGAFQGSPGVRVWAMISLKRLLNHTSDLAYLDLARSALGKWTINALQSSKRLLRIAAGYALGSRKLFPSVDVFLLISVCLFLFALARRSHRM